MITDKKVFAERLKERRIECGYNTLTSFARAFDARFRSGGEDLLGNNPSKGIIHSLKKYENPNNSTFPNLATAAEICQLLDCDIDYLLGYIDKPKHIYQAMHAQCGLANAATEQLIYWNTHNPKSTKVLNTILVSDNFDGALGYAAELLRTKPIYVGLSKIRSDWVEKTYSQPAPPEGYPDGSGLIDMYKQAETKYEIAKLRLTESLTFLISELERIAVEQK